MISISAEILSSSYEQEIPGALHAATACYPTNLKHSGTAESTRYSPTANLVLHGTKKKYILLLKQFIRYI
jgi:hypothetical protein